MVHIETVRVQNFRSIIDTGEVDVNSDIITLVGPNEAGKTNFLEALHSFRTDIKYEESDLSFRKSYSPKSEEIPIVTMKLSNVDLDSLQYRELNMDLDEEFEDSDSTVEITKYYDGKYEAEIPTDSRLISSINKRRKDRLENKVRELSTNYRKIVSHIDHDFDQDLRIGFLHARASSTDNPRKVQDITNRIEDQLRKISREVEDEVKSQIEDRISEVNRSIGTINRLSRPPSWLLASRIYNSAFKKGADLIQDEVPMEDLQEGSIDTFYSDILEFADVDPSRFYQMDPKSRYDRKVEAADKIEDGFNKYWPREHDIEFNVDFGGDTVSLHIIDESGSAELATHRSTGFRHFLSFYIRLIGASDELNDNILLLDGPGIHLHPEAQKRLKQALENLAEDNQVIYSTHSPFMIDSDEVDRLYILRQDLDEGTKILSDLDRAAQSKTEVGVLAPVRNSLGADFADSLFASSANILVEGYTDKRYLEAMSTLFQRKDGPTIGYETNIITFDGSKPDYLAKILEAEGYEYVILLDSDEAGKRKRDNLVEQNIPAGQICMIEDAISDPNAEKGLEIEDLFENVFYKRQVALTHDELDPDEFEEEPIGDSENIVDGIEGTLKELRGRDEISNERFKKSDVADLIARNINEGEYDQNMLGDNTIENFQALIRELNGKLDT